MKSTLPKTRPIQAGDTVTHPDFVQLNLAAQAVVIEVWTYEGAHTAELDNGLLLPLATLQPVATGELWATVAGYENYRLSSHGKLVSLQYNNQARHRLLKPLNARRYPEVRIGNGHTSLRIGLNRLVAQTFLPSPNDELLTVVLPKDGNRLNVRADNLQWASLNEVDNKTTWLYLRGYRTRRYKLTAADIARIRVLAAQGLTRQAIANQFGVSRPAVSVLLSSPTPRVNEPGTLVALQPLGSKAQRSLNNLAP